MTRTIPIFPQKAQRSAAALEFRVSPPLALYVHVPWCVQKCPYCDFNSHEAGETIPERAYVDALIADLQSALPLIWGRPVVSVFFGGGKYFWIDWICREEVQVMASMRWKARLYKLATTRASMPFLLKKSGMVWSTSVPRVVRRIGVCQVLRKFAHKAFGSA